VKRISQRDILPLAVKFRLSEFYDASNNTYKFRDNNGTAIFIIDPINGLVTFSSAGNRGQWVRLETQTVQDVATVDFDQYIDSTYQDYLIECTSVVPITDNVNLIMRISVDGGVNYLSDANYDFGYAHVYGGGGAFQGSSNSTAIEVAVGIGGASQDSAHSSIFIHSTPGLNSYKPINFISSHIAADENIVADFGGGRYDNSQSPINAVRLLMSSDNIDYGIFTLYGKRTD